MIAALTFTNVHASKQKNKKPRIVTTALWNDRPSNVTEVCIATDNFFKLSRYKGADDCDHTLIIFPKNMEN